MPDAFSGVSLGLSIRAHGFAIFSFEGENGFVGAANCFVAQ
jgi:hypothetical protein